MEKIKVCNIPADFVLAYFLGFLPLDGSWVEISLLLVVHRSTHRYQLHYTITATCQSEEERQSCKPLPLFSGTLIAAQPPAGKRQTESAEDQHVVLRSTFQVIFNEQGMRMCFINLYFFGFIFNHLDFCLGSWKVNLRPSLTSFVESNRFSSKIALYLASSIFRSTKKVNFGLIWPEHLFHICCVPHMASGKMDFLWL